MDQSRFNQSRINECDSKCSEFSCNEKCVKRFAHEPRKDFVHLCYDHWANSSQALKNSTQLNESDNKSLNKTLINVENREVTDLREIKNEFNYDALSERSDGSKKRKLLSTINFKNSDINSIYGNSFINTSDMPQENNLKEITKDSDLKEISSNGKTTKKSLRFGLCCCND